MENKFYIAVQSVTNLIMNPLVWTYQEKEHLGQGGGRHPQAWDEEEEHRKWSVKKAAMMKRSWKFPPVAAPCSYW